MENLVNNYNESEAFNYDEYSDDEYCNNDEHEYIVINLPKGVIGVILDKTESNGYIVKSFQTNNTVSHMLQIGDILYSINGKFINNTTTKDVVNLFKNYEDTDRVLIVKRLKIAPIIHGYITK